MLAAACSASAQTVPVLPAFVPVDDGQWTMPAKDYASSRFSTLAQIDADNVARLDLAFRFDTGIDRGQEAAPLVVGDTMFVVTPFPNILFALDLRANGALKWKYEPAPEPAAQGVACCDVVNRGAFHADGTIYFNTLDGNAVAVDAATGAPRWKVKLGDIHRGETITMAPLVVKNRVLVGNSGGEMGVRGWLAALDSATGAIAWKAFHTGTDADALIGAEFDPPYASDRGQDLGVQSWPPEAWKQGGGAAWGWISYDPELDLVYYGTGNPGPWNAQMRPGDNKWTSGMFARDPDTGAARWFYQFTPHDEHDYDAINESLLLDLDIDGKPRRVLVRAERNGYVYVMDRATGRVLSADAFFPVNSTLRIDIESGRPVINPAKQQKEGRVTREICPAALGAKDWNPSAYSPATGLMYIPHANLCMDSLPVEANYIAGTPYLGIESRMYAAPGKTRGEVMAWDIAQRKPRWIAEEDLPVWSGALATAGGLVFYGTMDGWFKAVDAHSGKLLWKYQTSSGIIGQPISYRGPDGRQYIAVMSGVGGWAGAIVAANLDPRDPTAALGFVGAVPDLKQRTQPGGSLYVFALPSP
jgi:PQQ-dependent dehydrogenase (methanol/ethanol family)